VPDLPVLFEVVLNAPPSFCYAWLTDYQPTDPKINPGMSARKVVERTRDTVKLVDEAVGAPYNRRNVTVTLHPPDAWEARAEGTIYDYDLHYRLSAEPKGTRLVIVGITHTKPSAPFKTREENHQRFVKAWGHYKQALEADFKAQGKP
jgi:hypothetical protein